MSTPATELPAKRENNILELPGQCALSRFRLKRLIDDLRQINGRVTGLSARFTYFVNTHRRVSDAERRLVNTLLQSDEPEQPLLADAQRIYVVPRPGTISPWSSKATEIALACELDFIARVERGICYAVSADRQLDDGDLAQLAVALSDRMTECHFVSPDDAGILFRRHDPAPLNKIPLCKDGGPALERANLEYGLALSHDEIEYLTKSYGEMGRDPTDAELMMFAQANSEHCRHKIFNANWVIDGVAEAQPLFDMIRSTTDKNPNGVVSAYSDNAAVIEGWVGKRLLPDPERHRFTYVNEPIQILMKVETHNHPTAISPFAGAATGAGGEIRDEGATGLGAKPKAGLTGFTVSHLRIPDFCQPWEITFPHPERMATPLQIMLEGPIGGAAFNNEFGRPNLLGYFRTYESRLPQLPRNEIHGFHKPIMIAGGIGNVRPQHALKVDVPVGAKIIVLGGPAMLIGLGGGAASSLASGTSSEDLDFASVQRGNPEMERRAQEVIDRCWAMGDDNPILLVHDVGAGGLSNAVPEAVDHSQHGAIVDLRCIPNAEPGMSPMDIWSNEAQERYVVIVAENRTSLFAELCARENCPHAVIGELTDDEHLIVTDSHFGNRTVDLPMKMLLGNVPTLTRETHRVERQVADIDLSGIELENAIFRILRFPAVADKTFLIHIGDRTVGGLSVRDQFVGPWQTPVSDVAITASGFESNTGEAMAMGERSPLASVNAAASARMAVGEAVTNIAAAAIGDIRQIRLSANWMAAAGHAGEDANLFDAVRAVGSELCQSLGIAIPVGKDSLSMSTRWEDDNGAHQVVAPVSLIVTAFAPVSDVRRHLTPQLREIDEPSTLLLIDAAGGATRVGGSCLAQVYKRHGGITPDVDNAHNLLGFFKAIQSLSERNLILAYHDRSDGGLFVTIAEMMFAGHLGASLRLAGSKHDLLKTLFNEELGAVVQIANSKLADAQQILQDCGADWIEVGSVDAADQLSIYNDDDMLVRLSRTDMQRAWSETSWRMQTLRDNPQTARQEYDRILDKDDPGLNVSLTFDLESDHLRTGDQLAPLIGGCKPKVAILREQGVNSQYEMAAAFMRAGFEAVDVHMRDLSSRRETLADYQGIIACGGFSFGDVLGAGGGWAKSILYQAILRDQFAQYFARTDTFSLGVCNGCQMMSLLKELIPGSDSWPRFLQNKSEQFEARLNRVEIVTSPSIFLTGMSGSKLPIATSHGEGRAVFASAKARQDAKASLRYVDNYGAVAERYPDNPNGSIGGICGLTSTDGRATIMMPHPERVVSTTQNSWHPDDWGKDGPWMRMFDNARVALR